MRIATMMVNSTGKQRLMADNEHISIELYFKNTKVYDLNLYADENENGTFSPLITTRDWRGEKGKN